MEIFPQPAVLTYPKTNGVDSLLVVENVSIPLASCGLRGCKVSTGDHTMNRSFAVRMARRNNLPTDLIDDLCQEAELAKLQGKDGQEIAERFAKKLANRMTKKLAKDAAKRFAKRYEQEACQIRPASQPTLDDLAEDCRDTVYSSDLAAIVPQADLLFLLSVASGERPNRGSANQRFQRILEAARTKAGVSIPSIV